MAAGQETHQEVGADKQHIGLPRKKTEHADQMNAYGGDALR